MITASYILGLVVGVASGLIWERTRQREARRHAAYALWRATEILETARALHAEVMATAADGMQEDMSMGGLN